MRRSQAGILAFLVLAAACVLMFALLPGAPREPADARSDPTRASARAHAPREKDGAPGEASEHDALEPARDALRTSAASADPPGSSADGRITGRVVGGRSSREPLAGARVRLRLSLSDPIHAVEATTDERGQFACDGLRSGGWFVEAIAHEHQKVSKVVRLLLESPAAEVELRLPMSRDLDVRAVDERALPLAFARLGVAPEYADAVRVGSLRAQDVAAGLAPRSTLHPLEYRGDRRREGELAWSLRRGMLADARVVLCVGERVAALALVPSASDALQLVVEDATLALLARDLDFVVTASGRPVAGAEVRLSLSQGGAPAASTDDSGRVRLEGVPHARMRLRVVAAGHPEHGSWIDADPVESTHVDLPQSRRIEGLVVADRAAPNESVRIGIWRIHEAEIHLGGPTRSAWSTRDAAFAFDDLEPGVYVLAGIASTRVRATATGVRRGDVPGALWVDLRAGDALGIVLEVGAVQELERLRSGRWPREPVPAGATIELKSPR